MSGQALFYRDKDIFGLDIGFDSLQMMQLDLAKKPHKVIGYGVATFDNKAIVDGVVEKPEIIITAVKKLLDEKLKGEISARRVNVSIPAERVFIRSMSLPLAASEDLDAAVRLEAEQYIPLPLSELNMDYVVINKTDKDISLLVVAVPKKIINSYLKLIDSLGLEAIVLEPTVSGLCRIFSKLDHADIPTLLIDIGTKSSDVILYDKALIASGSVPGGGDAFTELISTKLKTSQKEAYFLKTEYGLGLSYTQKEVLTAIKPLLDQIVLETRRVVRYYEEHNAKKQIGQIVTTGSASNLAGLNEYLTDTLRIPARSFAPWSQFDFGKLANPNNNDRFKLITAAGLSLIRPEEIFE